MDLNVPAGKAFAIRAIETYHAEQLKTYQFVVQPSDDTADGKVRVRFQDIPGDYDGRLVRGAGLAAGKNCGLIGRSR